MIIEITEEEAEKLKYLILNDIITGGIALLAVKLTEESEIILKIGPQE